MSSTTQETRSTDFLNVGRGFRFQTGKRKTCPPCLDYGTLLSEKSKWPHIYMPLYSWVPNIERAFFIFLHLALKFPNCALRCSRCHRELRRYNRIFKFFKDSTATTADTTTISRWFTVSFNNATFLSMTFLSLQSLAFNGCSNKKQVPHENRHGTGHEYPDIPR